MAAKTKLSKGILDMKFMKRTKDKVTKEQDDAEGRAMYASQITDKMLQHGECQYVCEPSFVPVEGLVEGRFSFRGMNPEIERLLELEELARQALLNKDVKKDVEDEEMADSYYGNAAKTMAKAFNRKGGHHGSHHHQPHEHGHGGGGAAGYRRKMSAPSQAPVANNDNNGYKKYSQQRHSFSGSAKKPRFLKPDQD